MSEAPKPDPYQQRWEMGESFRSDRWLAHSYLFPHRHTDESCEAHEALVRAIYSDHPRQLIEGFRGLGKSTYLEEAAVLKACLREFHNLVIVGASYTRACERLAAIKREILINRQVAEIFGDIREGVWQEGKIELKGGICIQALGREQSLLGIKHHDWRPDAALVDDVEDAEEVRTDQEREQTWGWFIRAFLPSLDHPLHSWVRVLGTRRGSGSLPERLEKSGFPSLKLPIETISETGARASAWPAKFPLAAIDRVRELYRGDMQTFMQEYMCEPTSQQDRIFTRGMFIRAPGDEASRPQWQAVYAMIDPARTTNRTSALTGWAVWSWVGSRLYVWAAGAESLKPDEIIELCFRIHEGWHPVWIGIEEDGLNEWVRQPLRHEQVKRHRMIPVRAVKAPRNKLGFIGGLQQYYNAGEVLHMAPVPELEAQLLSFPSGKIDAANALAYALTLRPQAPVYPGWDSRNMVDQLSPVVGRPLYLAANATRVMLSAVLCQVIDGVVRVLADWVVEGSPEEEVDKLHIEAGLWQDGIEREVDTYAHRLSRLDELLKIPEKRLEFIRLPLEWVVPQVHRDRWHNVGLLQAIGRIPARARVGSVLERGRREVEARLGSTRPRLLVSARAEWTLRGFAGGYTRSLASRGTELAAEAEPGPYRLLMEGLEAFCGSLSVIEEADETEGNMALDKHGRPYLSAMPQR
jgi:hypothetical protein